MASGAVHLMGNLAPVEDIHFTITISPRFRSVNMSYDTFSAHTVCIMSNRGALFVQKIGVK